jgi:hypothetical protein
MQEKIVMTIDFDPSTNRVMVNGPIKNRILSYGMLKMAEKALDEDYAQRVKEEAKEEATGIIPIAGNGSEFLRRR